MSAVTGTFATGRSNCTAPARRLGVRGACADNRRDRLSGDSPEVIAARLRWYEEFANLSRDSEAAEELERILADRKSENQAMWEQHVKRASRIPIVFAPFPHHP